MTGSALHESDMLVASCSTESFLHSLLVLL